MDKLFFPTLSSNEFLDRFFDQFFRLFPTFISLEIRGEDGKHNLAFSNSEEISKSIQFIKYIYHNNRKITSYVKTKKGEKKISFREENNIHTLSIVVESIKTIFLLLRPLWIQSEQFYYSNECFMTPSNDPFKISYSKCMMKKWMIKNYSFRNELHHYINKIDFIPMKNRNYQYNFQTFLPEKIVEDKLLRLLIFLLSKKFDALSHLQFLHLNHEIIIDRSHLKKEKKLHFSSKYFHLKGFIKPIGKIINL